MSNQSGCPPVGVQLEAQILPPVLGLDVILGLIGNSVALWIFCCKLKTWNPNNIFLFNLLIADFMALVSLPLRIDALVRSFWVFGDGLCRINLFLMFSNRSASIAMMTVVATYRYLKVVHPLSSLSRLSRLHAVIISAVVWTLVAAPRVPMLSLSHIKVLQNQTQCFFFTSYGETSALRLGLVSSHRIITVLEFVFPFSILVFCSIRISRFLKARGTVGDQKKVKRAMRVCVVIVGVFVLCFMPTSVTTAGIWIVQSQRPWNCTAFYTLTQLTIVSLGLNFLNSALDPLLYVFSSSNFRKALVQSLPQCLQRRTKPKPGPGPGPGPNQSQSETGSTAATQSTSQHELMSIN
ncbi:hydroxycarboxylic acid receptor 3-like [Periophthalmus magnuspinnatus]|uniref:hydroxycarboxylic acid receptor 3-like n=1 Tax=Periophthalmus magnuspinnatus TaxID=409849 RepID=UPI00145AFA10|nr:hydroxycarboxylic acid receptor 3-like [Periophthalmus magnuspinnatus]